MENKEIIKTQEGKSIDLDPNLLVDSIDHVNIMVNAHGMIIRSVRALIKMYVDSGMKPDEAAAVAMEFQRRAGKKANELDLKAEAEEQKKEEVEKDAGED